MKSFFNHNGTDQIYRLRHGNIMQSQQHHLSLYVSRVVISVIRYTTSELAMNKHMIRMQGHPRVLSFCAFILLAFLKLKRVPFSNQMTQNDIQIGLGNDISQNKKICLMKMSRKIAQNVEVYPLGRAKHHLKMRKLQYFVN